MAKRKRHWMQRAFSRHPGKLHRQLHVPEGETIPASKLRRAAHSRNPAMRREVALAKTGKRFGGKRHRRRSGRRA